MSNTENGQPGLGSAGLSSRPTGSGAPEGSIPESPAAESLPRTEVATVAPTRPRIGDTRPAPAVQPAPAPVPLGRPPTVQADALVALPLDAGVVVPDDGHENGASGGIKTEGGGAKRSRTRRRSGRERKGKSVGRY